MRARNQAEMKIKNKNQILKLIITKGPISRVQLAQITGLTKMSVTNIVSELMGEHIVEETKKVKTAVGRSPVRLDIVAESRLVVGIYISRDKIISVLGDIKGRILRQECAALCNESTQSFEGKILGLAGKMVEGKEKEKIWGIGVSCIGPLDRKRGLILNPPNFFGILHVEISKLLLEHFALPVFLENDMNASALAETYFGNAKELKNFIYLGVTNGIGAGIISGGVLYSGERGFGGEIGHTTIDINGPKCSCGNNGCLEMYASLGRDFNLLAQDEKNARLKKVCCYLGAGCVTLINLFDPQMIFLGHDIASCGTDAANLLNMQIKDKYISTGHKDVGVEISAFLDLAPIYGSVAVCVDNLIG